LALDRAGLAPPKTLDVEVTGKPTTACWATWRPVASPVCGQRHNQDDDDNHAFSSKTDFRHPSDDRRAQGVGQSPRGCRM